MESPQEDRLLLVAALALALAAIWAPGLPFPLYGVDAGCYARVARELAQRDLSAWPHLTLGGAPFFEHPPLAFWLESLAFRAGGSSVEVAVIWARTLASLFAIAVLLVARAAAGPRAGAFAAFSLVLLAGYLKQVHNPMLELPLMLAFAVAVGGAASLGASPAAAVAMVAAGFVGALFIKGPPALAVLPVVAWAGWAQKRWKVAAVAIGASLVVGLLAVGLFEQRRSARGLEPFFPRYFRDQVLASFVEGRHHPDPSPWYYARPLVSWYLAALLAVPLSLWAWARRRPGDEKLRRLIELGWLVSGVVVVGFSLARQKYDWYIHPAMLGMALFMGASLSAALPSRWDRRVAVGGLVAAALMAVVLGAGLWPFTPLQQELLAMQRQPRPVFVEGAPHTIAHCGTTGRWKAEHLFAFLWDAELVPCDAAAAYRFDGNALVRVNQ